MKKATLLLTLVMGLSPFKAADIETQSGSDDEDSIVTSLESSPRISDGMRREVRSLPHLVELGKEQKVNINPRSQEVSEAYIYFGGQNIESVREIDYVERFQNKKCSIQTLYALYVTLLEYREGSRWKLDDINRGFTNHNFNFLRDVFEDTK